MGVIANRLVYGFTFAFVYQIIVAIATSILSIPLSGNISDLFLGIEKAGEEGVVLIVWWIISTIIITIISLVIIKNRRYFSPFRNEKNIQIPPNITPLTAIVVGAIISFTFFLMDTLIGTFVSTNTTDVEAIYQAALDGNFIPLYLSIIFSIVTGFTIVGVVSKTSKVVEITRVNELTRLSKLIKKKSEKSKTLADTVGLRPGELVHIGEKKVEEVRIDLLEYDQDNSLESKNTTIEECLKSKVKSNVSWVNIIGIHDANIIKKIGDAFGLHTLHQANIMYTELRPTIEISDNYIFLLLKMPHFNVDKGKVELEQISLIIAQHHLITFQEIEKDFFENIRKRLRDNVGTIRKKPSDYLGYALLDAVIDSYFLVLEKISDISENLEEELLSNPTPNTLQALQQLKRQMILLRRSVWPSREVLDSLQRSQTVLIHEETKTYLRDSYNHLVQVIDTIEGLRDVVGGMLDTYLSSVSNKMNEVMKTLTIIASIFIPITFIAGVYGTNFEYIPELSWEGSYFVMLGGMAIISGLMLAWFKKKHWM